MNNRPILITGGAGFIGTNTAEHYLNKGESVLLLDNLSRAGVRDNYEWLHRQFGDRVQLVECDVRDQGAVREAVNQSKAVCHFAAQVAVTTSLTDPREDFEINALGALNVLEAIRLRQERRGERIPLLFTSTNKVYGNLDDVGLVQRGPRYQPTDEAMARWGVPETRPLDFHSPYGCSKGAADQYVRDYARTYDLPLVVFRMSCIYGPHQKGTEDQGWVAHFLLQVLKGREITLYGDGKQVRDLLFVQDLVRAIDLAFTHMDKAAGQVFNVGGGPENQASLREVLEMIPRSGQEGPLLGWGDWRPGDQKFYVSDTRKMAEMLGWRPEVGVEEGVARLYEWLSQDLKTAHSGVDAAVATAATVASLAAGTVAAV